MPRAYAFTEYGGVDTQDFVDLPEPTPGPSELLVQVRAAGVNPIDWKIRAGHLQAFMPVTFPAVLGREVSGVVRGVGKDVAGFAVGDEVFGPVAPGSGGYAEFALVTATSAAKKPVHVSFTDAATLSVAAGTAHDALQQLELIEGQTLLITGIGGGVGVAAAQLARDAGVFVLGTGSESKRALVESLGATLIDYHQDVAGQVRQLFPDGVDAVLDVVGGDALRDVAGLLSPFDGGDVPRIVSSADPQTAAEVGGTSVERQQTTEVYTALAQLVADGKLDPHVEDTFTLDQAAEALAGVEGGHSRGKIVITVS
ncbi:NADP-dependent oxidoreductase [Nakamurella flavida]|uniref:NADP-dependent oxidoreductase n=1 Tax=Nakamurella flavida TaxID=363630 RepID=A0A939C346_9ACTN|nr:NADP-dependent oxidoreductase [Nakamurella flavida]MBM9477255.1 NADP-dependent oxidoreductase [Nakamurella flavida]MDP9779711.1 NADPH2:quinone reductase [Nakamurella flavida]